MPALLGIVTGVVVLALSGCGVDMGRQTGSGRNQHAAPVAIQSDPVIARLRQEVQGDLERHVGAEQAAVSRALGRVRTFPAVFKPTVVLQGLTDPWTGLIALERLGLRLAGLARSLLFDQAPALPDIISTMEAGMARAPDPRVSPKVPKGSNPEEHLAYLIAVLEQAHLLREKAVRKLSLDDRRFLFEHAASIVEQFIPQLSALSESPPAQAKLVQEDRRFYQLVTEQLDYSALIAAAQVLAGLADEEWMQRLSEAFHDRQALPSSSTPAGITGEVLLVQETPFGMIVIGGPGANSYELDRRFALVIDVGGDDTYRGSIAAGADAERGISVVIDLAGNDTYDAAPMGLATGRLGVGLLIDRKGDDVYHLDQGSGGSGFAGLGILYDMAGDDRYVGSRFTQGAAVAGLGLLLDRSGNDRHTSFGYALGFAGPLGVGAVIDVAGSDHYQCGGKYPSLYNAIDLPGGSPDDPRFQYDGFCLGTGSGQRILSEDPEQLVDGLAGGLGMLIDLEGNDRYRSANFSQGFGYFFGAGLKLDLAGDDEHAGARYGHGASAHYGVGLFIDYRGDDRYTSTGPLYNGGVAWDLSVSLCIDAGQGNDVYDLRRSDGLGRADFHSWSVFIEEGGRDRYLLGGDGGARGMGMASNGSMSGFFDLAGEDEYVVAARGASSPRGNGRILLDQAGGLFVDH